MRNMGSLFLLCILSFSFCFAGKSEHSSAARRRKDRRQKHCKRPGHFRREDFGKCFNPFALIAREACRKKKKNDQREELESPQSPTFDEMALDMEVQEEACGAVQAGESSRSKYKKIVQMYREYRYSRRQAFSSVEAAAELAGGKAQEEAQSEVLEQAARNEALEDSCVVGEIEVDDFK